MSGFIINPYALASSASASGYRYYRVDILENNGDSYTVLSLVEIRTSVGGAQAATGGTPSASTELASPNDSASAFDTDDATAWWTSLGNGAPSWIQYDLGAGNGVTAAEYALRNRDGTGAAARSPRTFQLWGSNNGTDWTVLDGRGWETAWGTGETRVFELQEFTGAQTGITAASSFDTASFAQQFGWEFAPNYDIEVSSLRFYAAAAATETVRLWRVSDSSLVASASVTSGAGSYGSTAITAVTLEYGERYVVTHRVAAGTTRTVNRTPTTLSFNAAVTRVQDRFVAGDGFPTTPSSGNYVAADIGFELA